jgi:hypothetical protein
LILSVVFAVLGLVSLGWLTQQRLLARRSAHWPRVRGTLRAVTDEDEQLFFGAVSYRNRPRIRYVYEVDGHLFTGNRVFFGDEIVPERSRLSREVYGLREGSEVVVRYNPRNPGQATIDTEPAGRLAGVSQMSTVFLLFAGAFAWLSAHPTALHAFPQRYLAVAALLLGFALLTTGGERGPRR